MTARLSTGLVQYLMGTGSFKDALTAGFIDVYTGTQPATPDAAATGTKLCTVYSDGASAGLTFSLLEPVGVLSKLGSQTWSGTAVAAGTAGWFRLRAANDPGTVAAGGTITGATRAASTAMIVFAETSTTRLVGDKVVMTGFTAAAYNGNFTVVAVSTNAFTCIGNSIAGGGGDSASVVGTYTYSRPAADAGTTLSTSALRYDGAIGTSGVEMNLGSLSVLNGAPFVISTATFTLPQQ